MSNVTFVAVSFDVVTLVLLQVAICLNGKPLFSAFDTVHPVLRERAEAQRKGQWQASCRGG